MISRNVIQKFIAGDRSATNAVYEEYRRLMYFVIATYVENPEDCNDVLSEAFLKAMENRASLKEPSKLRSFLCSIAKNEAINFSKKKRAESSSDIIEEMYGEQDQSNDALSMIEPLLSSKETIVVYYKAVFGYTWKEIVEETNIPDSSARLLYKRGIEKLRKEWKK